MYCKIIIAGSRDFDDYNKLCRVLNRVVKNTKTTEIVSGGAIGADRLGERYAKENNIKITIFKADWDRFGKSAGYRRNAEMAKYADGLIAFWDGKSRGTKHMIDLATKENIAISVTRY